MKKIWLTVPFESYEGPYMSEAFAFADEGKARDYADLNATGRSGGVGVYELEILVNKLPPRPVFDCERYQHANGDSDVFCNFREFFSRETDLARPGTFLAISHDDAIKAATAGLPDVEDEE